MRPFPWFCQAGLDLDQCEGFAVVRQAELASGHLLPVIRAQGHPDDFPGPGILFLYPYLGQAVSGSASDQAGVGDHIPVEVADFYPYEIGARHAIQARRDTKRFWIRREPGILWVAEHIPGRDKAPASVVGERIFQFEYDPAQLNEVEHGNRARIVHICCDQAIRVGQELLPEDMLLHGDEVCRGEAIAKVIVFIGGEGEWVFEVHIPKAEQAVLFGHEFEFQGSTFEGYFDGLHFQAVHGADFAGYKAPIASAHLCFVGWLCKAQTGFFVAPLVPGINFDGDEFPGLGTVYPQRARIGVRCFVCQVDAIGQDLAEPV